MTQSQHSFQIANGALAITATPMKPSGPMTATAPMMNLSASPHPQPTLSLSPASSDASPELSLAGQLLSSAPVRRYKQYTEEHLQQALREIMEGQSINRSSNKFNIPARTLRDEKRCLLGDIHSCFLHNMYVDKSLQNHQSA